MFGAFVPQMLCERPFELAAGTWGPGDPSPGLSEARVAVLGPSRGTYWPRGGWPGRRELSAGDDLSFLR